MVGLRGIGSGDRENLRTLQVALILCLVCSVIVSAAAVWLKPLQSQNQAADRKKNILLAAGLLDDESRVDALYAEYIEAKVVDLETGEYAENIDPLSYDARKAARDPVLSETVAPEIDIAGIRRRARYAAVYLVRDKSENNNSALQSIVLPVHGYGLWSTMYGFMALAPDTRSVIGLKFYEHGETPGLGGEIDNADWLAQWRGKVVYDGEWQPSIKVVKGSASGENEVDGLAGATLTSRGVMNMLQYWLGEQGFGPYLKRLRQQEVAALGR